MCCGELSGALRGGGMGGYRRLVPLVEGYLAGMEGIDLVLPLIELPLGTRRPLLGLRQRAGQPLDLLCGSA
jgi:hypothetical protein